MVTVVSLVGLLIYFVATATIGVRLLRLAFHTRQLPELTTGIGYIAGGTLGWSLVLAGHEPSILHTPTGLVLRTCAVFFLSLGSLSVGIGLWRIFHPERAWVGVTFGVVAVALIADFVRNAVIERTPFVLTDTVWFWPGALGRAFAFVWLPFESLRYYRMLRRRQRLGLADPLIVQRFLLWSVSGFTTLATTIVALSGSILRLDGHHPELFLAAYALFGVTGATTLWLAFFPPDRYADAVQKRAAAAAKGG